jgi:predicted CoA-substrate-specific enzyme activase
MRGYLGVDVGSVSTNFAIIGENSDVIETLYLRTRGNPTQAVREGLSELKDRMGPDCAIEGAGTTGSARRLTGGLIGADLVKNEITAHAVGALHYYPDTSTVLEIGGQDSKLILIREGVVVDFAMNTVCAAGTGSFLDHQAGRLGIPIEKFGEMASRAKSRVNIASKCTVFSESDMIHKAQLGVPTESIVKGLCYGIVSNYLNNLAKGKRIEPKVVFQGGVAYNIGVKSAFEEALDLEVTVPANAGTMGAIGIALLTRDVLAREERLTQFAGLDIADVQFDTKVFECDNCPNTCEVVEVNREGRLIDRYGHRCDRWDMSVSEERKSALLP